MTSLDQLSQDAVERIARESWNAIIDGAAHWDEQDDYTKDMHTQTTLAVIRALLFSEESVERAARVLQANERPTTTWDDWSIGAQEDWKRITREMITALQGGLGVNLLTHYETAQLILQRIQERPGWYGDTPAVETLARAQVHATLALVAALKGGGDE